MANVLLRFISVGVLLLVPHAVVAQCGGGGAGHNHGGAPVAKVDSKTEKAINQVLSTSETRRAFLDAAMTDSHFVHMFLGRIAQDPGWSAEAADVLGHGSVDAGKPVRTEVAGEPQPPADVKPVSPLYSCPMHPEVTSEKPGSCPKCGMALRRAE